MILSDGDVVFQPRKVQLSGIWDASNSRYMAPDMTISRISELAGMDLLK